MLTFSSFANFIILIQNQITYKPENFAAIHLVAKYDRPTYDRCDQTSTLYKKPLYERIIQDVAVYCEQLFLTNEGGEDREQALHYLRSNFWPNGTIEIAYQSYKTLSSEGAANEVLSFID